MITEGLRPSRPVVIGIFRRHVLSDMPRVRDFPLPINPRGLLDTSLAQLRTLTAFLSDHLPQEMTRQPDWLQ